MTTRQRFRSWWVFATACAAMGLARDEMGVVVLLLVWLVVTAIQEEGES